MAGEAIEGLRQGLTALRRLFYGAGYSYGNATLPLPEGFAPDDFSDAPRLIAKTGDENFAVLYFPVRRLDAEAEAGIHRRLSAYGQRSLYLFADGGGRWDILCPPQDAAAPQRFRLSLDLASVTDAQAALLDQIIADADDGIRAHERISALLAQEVPQRTARAAEREGGLQDGMAWWMSIVGKCPILTADEERWLVRRAARGDDEARQKIILSNLRLVVHLARDYQWSGIPLPDLIQEGNIGLIHALDKYDYRKGYRFTTYATPWIKQGLGRAAENFARLIRFPSYIIERTNNLRQARSQLETLLGRDPTAGEIAARLNVHTHKVRYWMALENWKIGSFDEPLESGVTTFGHFLPASREFAPDVRLRWRTICEEIERGFLVLTPRERQTLILRFGLAGKQEEATLEEVGQVLQLSRERARQIESVALGKLRQRGVRDWLRHEPLSGEWGAFAVQGAALDEQSLNAARERAVQRRAEEEKRAQNPAEVCAAPPPPRQRKTLVELRREYCWPSSDVLAPTPVVAPPPAVAAPTPCGEMLLRTSGFVPSVIGALCKRLGHDARLRDVARLTRADLRSLSGIGEGKIRKLIQALTEAGLSLQEEAPAPIVHRPAAPVADAPIITVSPPALAPRGPEEMSALLFALEEVPQTVCQNCGMPVVLKPTLMGKWYRCKACKDTRVVPASA